MSGNTRQVDAYRHPRRIVPGCQHQLGCKCEPPYWLRPSSLAEQKHEQRMEGRLLERQDQVEEP